MTLEIKNIVLATLYGCYKYIAIHNSESDLKTVKSCRAPPNVSEFDAEILRLNKINIDCCIVSDLKTDKSCRAPPYESEFDDEILCLNMINIESCGISDLKTNEGYRAPLNKSTGKSSNNGLNKSNLCPKSKSWQPKINTFFGNSDVKSDQLSRNITNNEISEKDDINIVQNANIINVDNIDDNIDSNIGSNIDKYPVNNDSNIRKITSENVLKKPSVENKWTSFGDIKIEKSIVRLPNPAVNKSKSGTDAKVVGRKVRGRKYQSKGRKEEERTEKYQNPIMKYFTRVEPSMNQSGKRKLEVDKNEISKKIRAGQSNYRTGERHYS